MMHLFCIKSCLFNFPADIHGGWTTEIEKKMKKVSNQGHLRST